MASSWQGRIVDGRYTLGAPLGEGGMGVVYRARHVMTGGEVALKLMHPHVAAFPDVAARFLAQARAPAAIGHAGIVKVSDAGRTPEGELYLVMELLRGETLRQRLDRERPGPDLVFRWTLQVLDALGAAHSAGIVHRDLKPENVFLVEGAVPKLLDFGIAKVDAAGAVTATGSVMGTAQYMSPEQLRDTSKVDRGADLWAVAVILYEALTGRRPFEGSSGPDVLVDILSKPAPLASAWMACSSDLDAFFARAFASDPNQRFASAAEMAAAISLLSPIAAIAVSPAAIGPTTLASATPSTSGVASVPIPVPLSTMRSEYNPLLDASRAAPPAPPPPTLAAKKTLLPTGAWIGIGLLGLALVSGAIGLVVVALGGDAVSAPTTPAHRGTSAPHPRGSAAESDDLLCERACEELERCTSVSVSNCRADCAHNAEYRSCVRPLLHADCKGAALCALGAGCSGKVPQGHSTCRQAIECELACTQRKGNGVACACGCVEKAAPDKAIELAANNLCAATNCASDCKAPANPIVCGACMNQHCKAANQNCLSH